MECRYTDGRQSLEIETRKGERDMLGVKSCEINNTFDKLISTLHIAEEKISN